MRAGMKLGHINYHANQPRRTPTSSILVALVCLSSILWLSVAPTFFATRCGLLLPHDHLLLGGASESDLQTHLSIEAACATGGALDTPPVDDHISIGGGTIVSVSRFEPQSTPPVNILAMDQLALVIPALLIGSSHLTLFVWRVPSPRVVERPYFLPPWDPPPRNNLMLAD